MAKPNEFYIAKSGSIITAEGRLSYAQHLFRPNPKATTEDGKLKYTISILLPPDTDLTLARKAIADAIDEEWPVGSKSRPKNPKLPFLDAGEKAGEEWEGWTLIRASTTKKPAVVEGDMTPASEENVYSGRWARLSLVAKATPHEGNKGGTFYLNNVQLLRHDDPIGGSSPKAESDFEPVVPAGGSFGEDDNIPF